MTTGEIFAEVNNINIPLTWMLGIVGSLATTVTVLAKLLWDFVKGHIAEMKRQMRRMQKRIDALQRGCGVSACVWRLPNGAPELAEDED